MTDAAATPPGATGTGTAGAGVSGAGTAGTGTAGAPAESTLLTGGLDREENAFYKTDREPGRESGRESGQAGLVPESPDGYAFTFAKEVSVDTALLGAFKPAAHKLGITQAQAQGMADFYAEHAAAAAAETSRRQGEALRQAVDGWEAEIKAMPGYAGMRTDAQRALAQYGSPELFQVIDDTLIGSHPAMFRFMAAVGKALAEPAARGRGSAGGPLTAEKIFYPDMQ